MAFSHRLRCFLLAAWWGSLALAPARGQAIELLSGLPAANSGLSASGDSTLPIWSGGSRYLGFHSDAPNLVTNKTSWRQVNAYLRDRAEKKTHFISVPLRPEEAPDGSSVIESISADGSRVAFVSDASNLHGADTNGVTDIFVRDMTAGQTVLVSVRQDGAGAGNGASHSSVMTPNGRWVVFASEASNLVEGDTNNAADIFVRDLETGVTSMANVHANAADNRIWREGASLLPQISNDGRYVAFLSSSNYTKTPSAVEVFLRDRVQNQTIIISRDTAAFRALLRSASPSQVVHASSPVLSANGTAVAYKLFSSTAGIVVHYDIATGVSRLVGSNAAPATVESPGLSGPLISDDGKQVVFETQFLLPNTLRQIVRWNADTGASEVLSRSIAGGLPSKTGDSFNPMMNGSGSVITFLSSASDLIASPAEGPYGMYVFDAATSSLSVAGSVESDSEGDVAAPSADGKIVAWHAAGSGLVPGDLNGRYDVYAQDLNSADAELISERHSGLPELTGDSPASLASLSPSGANLVWHRRSEGAANGAVVYDIHSHDIAAGASRVSQIALEGGGVMEDAAVSANGRYLVFTTTATNLVPGDLNRDRDVFLTDLQSGETALVSVATNGLPPASGSSMWPSISADGSRVMFQSTAKTLARTGQGASRYDVYVYHRESKTVELASVRPNGLAGNNVSANGVISPDGRYAAFLTRATDFVALPPGFYNWRWMVRDLQAGVTLYLDNFVSSRTTLTERDGVFSADSRFFVYVSAEGSSTTPRRISMAQAETWAVSAVCAGCANPSVSASGQFVAYEKLSAGGSAQQLHCFDRVTGQTHLISHAESEETEGDAHSYLPRLSGDGRYVVFKSRAGNLASPDYNPLNDLFIWERDSGKVSLLVPIPPLLDVVVFGNHQISADGSMIAFESNASHLAQGDFTEQADVFLWKRNEGNPDSDSDGLPDEWERLHFSSLGQDGAGDADGDGASNLDEFRAGTSPVSAQSVFAVRVSTLADGSGGLQLSWSAVPGRSYQLFSSDSLTPPAWTAVGGPAAAAESSIIVTLPAPAAAQRYYRIALAD